MDLTVATFNIRNGRAFDGFDSWPFRRRATAEALRCLDADVIGLQEVYACQLRYLRRRLPDYRVVGEGRNRGGRGEHTPVAVRAMACGDVCTRWFDVAGSRFPRIATTVRLPGFSFTSTHLDEASTQRRNESARQLRAWLDDTPGPHVVVGDFNAEANASLFDTLGLVRADPGPTGTTHHFKGNTDGRQIDHILVSPGIEIVDASVAHPCPGGRLPSDHWPVVARLRIPSP